MSGFQFAFLYTRFSTVARTPVSSNTKQAKKTPQKLVFTNTKGSFTTSTFEGGRVSGFGIQYLLMVVDVRRGGWVYKSQNVDGC